MTHGQVFSKAENSVRVMYEGLTERKDTMTFVYPAVFTPKKDGKGYDAYFPDLECCEAEGPDLEDAVENARDPAYNWISLELEEEGDLPAQTHIDDMNLPEGSMVKQIMVRIKLLPDND